MAISRFCSVLWSEFKECKQLPALVRHSRTSYCATMATNLDIDLAAVDTLIRLGGYRSKREAVDAAVSEAIAFRQQLKTLDALGTIDFMPLAPAAAAPEPGTR